MRGLTLRDTAFVAGITPMGGLPVPSGLILRNESSDFDAIPNGTNLTSWNDLSGGGHNWALIIAPTVDQVIKANGHATVKFTAGSNNELIQNSYFGASGFSGLEVMCVYRHAADPPADPQGAGGAFQFNQNVNDASHQPYANEHFYENFGADVRQDLGISAINTAAAFCCYNVAVAADGSAYDAWVNLNNFFHAVSGYTFNQEGVVDKVGSPNQGYRIGKTIFVGFTNYFFTGNIAAVYVWNRRLSAGERTAMRAFITTMWGVVF